MTADVSDAAGNAAPQVTSSSFAVDTSVPSINAIGTRAFSWGEQNTMSGTLKTPKVKIHSLQGTVW